jgi:hypothetical protein
MVSLFHPSLTFASKSHSKGRLVTIRHGWKFVSAGNTKGGSITVPLTSSLTGLDWSVFQIKTKIVSCHTADSKPVKLEVNGTGILHPLVFPGQ